MSSWSGCLREKKERMCTFVEEISKWIRLFCHSGTIVEGCSSGRIALIETFDVLQRCDHVKAEKIDYF